MDGYINVAISDIVSLSDKDLLTLIHNKVNKSLLIYIDYNWYVDKWNEKMDSFKNIPKIIKLTEPRKIKIRRRVEQNHRFNKDFETCLDKIGESDFLRGITTHWTASFQWLIENENNYRKVLEGNYDNKDFNKKNDISYFWGKINKS